MFGGPVDMTPFGAIVKGIGNPLAKTYTCGLRCQGFPRRSASRLPMQAVARALWCAVGRFPAAQDWAQRLTSVRSARTLIR